MLPLKVLKEAKPKVAILTHVKADIDALVGAELLKRTLAKLSKEAEILLYKEPAKEAAKLAKAYGISYRQIESLPEGFSSFIIVDTSSTTQQPLVKKAYAVFDHHESAGDDIPAEHMFREPSQPSVAYYLYKLLGEEFFGEEEKELLLVAIIADTYRFKHLSASLAEDVAKLLREVNKSYEELLSLAFPRKDKDEAVSLLETFKRVEYERYKGYLIVLSIAEDETREAASLLAEIGDIAVVMRQDGDNVRASVRCHPSFPLKLNEIAKEMGMRLGGNGGGHERAAGFKGKGNVEDALKVALETIKEFIDK